MLWHPNKVTEQEKPLSLIPRVGRKEVAGEGLGTRRRRRKKPALRIGQPADILPRGPPTLLFVSRDKMGRGRSISQEPQLKKKDPVSPPGS